jgi:uncharacterized protein (DUF2236 family)
MGKPTTPRSDPTDDLGLFGPDSVSWRVHAEPILWLSAFRALLLQMMEPRALAGVLQNSNFREDPWGRLWRTAMFFGNVIFGTTADAERAGARVRGVHSRLRGSDPDTGETFRVDDPDLLRWIHVTAVESFCSTAVRAGLALTPSDVDGYYAEQRRTAALVGLDPATVPGTAAEVEAYYDDMRPRLRVGSEARQTALYLVVPPFPWGLGYSPVRPLWIGVAAYGASLLPRWARRMYGLPALPTTDLSATLTSRTVRLALRALPSALLEGPIYSAAMARAGRASSPEPAPKPTARDASAGRKASASGTIANASAPGTAKAKRRPAPSAMTPMRPVPTTKPA